MALDGDALAIAHQALRDALHGGELRAAKEFNRRLRGHFDAFDRARRYGGADLEDRRPRTAAPDITDALSAEGVGAYISRRIEELGLLGNESAETGSDSQDKVATVAEVVACRSPARSSRRSAPARTPRPPTPTRSSAPPCGPASASRCTHVFAVARVGEAEDQLRVSRAGKPYVDERTTLWL